MEEKAMLPKRLERAKEDIWHDTREHSSHTVFNLSIKDILSESCFYLSAGADITPVVAFKDVIFSYVYCDLYLYDAVEGVENRFYGILAKLKDRLCQQGFQEIQKFNLDKEFLGIRDIHHSNGHVQKLENCEISLWKMEGKIYSILYINHDNTSTYRDLYIKNGIIPKAICELLPEGGSLFPDQETIHQPNLRSYEKNSILPLYVLGHLYSVGDANRYEKIADVDYFGDYLYSVDENGKHVKAKKGEVPFLQICKRKD